MEMMGMITAFIAIAIMLAIGVGILGSDEFIDCDSLQSNWTTTCESVRTETISAYDLLILVLIIIAAVVILAVVTKL